MKKPTILLILIEKKWTETLLIFGSGFLSDAMKYVVVALHYTTPKIQLD